MNQEVTRVAYGILCLMIVSFPGLLLTDTLSGTTLPHCFQIEKKEEEEGEGAGAGAGEGREEKGREGIMEF